MQQQVTGLCLLDLSAAHFRRSFSALIFGAHFWRSFSELIFGAHCRLIWDTTLTSHSFDFCFGLIAPTIIAHVCIPARVLLHTGAVANAALLTYLIYANRTQTSVCRDGTHSTTLFCPRAIHSTTTPHAVDGINFYEQVP